MSSQRFGGACCTTPGARAVNFALLGGMVLSGVGLALLLEWRLVGRRRAG